VSRILAHGGLRIPLQERDDLEQEVMTEVWQAVNRSQFDFSGGFWGFVEVVTARRCIDWLRGRQSPIPFPEDLESSETGPLGRALVQERAELVSEVLARLGPPCRELLSLRMRESLSYGEIAQIVGKPEGALRVQVYRCVRRARKILERMVPAQTSGSGDREHP
jgi:RNA polymerase sigma-70 factor (ECF subfamily)